MLVPWEQGNAFLFARVMELVDVPDSKSGGATRAGSSPAPGTIRSNTDLYFIIFLLTNNCGIKSACQRVVFSLAYMLDSYNGSTCRPAECVAGGDSSILSFSTSGVGYT